MKTVMRPDVTKIARKLVLPTPLLQHLPVVRGPLFTFLTKRDVVTLLGTCHALRDDDETVAYALATNRTAHCFFQGCSRDWCAIIPQFTHIDCYQCDRSHREYSDDTDDDDTEEEETGSDDDGASASQTTWTANMLPPARRASLLSLATLMQAELKTVLYNEDQAYAMLYSFIPFIQPLTRVNNLASSPMTPLGLHIASCNLNASDRGGNSVSISCAFCTALEAATEEDRVYQEKREIELAELQQQLCDDGYETDSDEVEAAIDAFHESKRETDAMYGGDEWDGCGPSRRVADLCVSNSLPHVSFTEDISSETAEEATSADFVDDAKNGLCASSVRPLLAFVRRHGFGSVRRLMLCDYDLDEGNLYAYDIRRITMVGATAPHGFFAGVYVVECYT